MYFISYFLTAIYFCIAVFGQERVLVIQRIFQVPCWSYNVPSKLENEKTKFFIILLNLNFTLKRYRNPLFAFILFFFRNLSSRMIFSFDIMLEDSGLIYQS